MDTIGIYLDGPTLRMATAKKKRGSPSISDVKSFNLSVDRPNVKPLYMTRFVSGLPTHEVLFRTSEVPLSRHRELSQALSHHADTTHHLDPEEALAAPFLRGGNRILYALTTRTALAHHLKRWKHHEIDPDWVIPIPTALAHYWQWELSAAEGWILDIGFNETTVAMLEEGIITASHGIPIGMGQLYEALALDRRQSLLPTEAIDLERAHGPFRDKLDELVSAIATTLRGLDRIETPRPLLLSGHLDAFPAFSSFLFRSLKTPTELHLAENSKTAIAIGLAIGGLNPHFNFRTGSYLSRREWIRSISLVSLLIGTSLAASAALWGWGHRELQLRRDAIATTLGSLVPSPLQQQLLIDRAPDQILKRWKVLVQDAPKSPPYPLMVPTAQEAYSWWDAHPLRRSLGLQLESLTYDIDPLPRLENTHVKPEARVRIAFTVDLPSNARKFYDALSSDPDVIGPIEWNGQGNRYDAGFTLRHHAN